jgi:transcriptional regulator with XRE-family HTH domain
MAQRPSHAAAATEDARGRNCRDAGGVDLEVCRRIRRRRVALSVTQQRLAELVGVTYQQAHKYETGANRISTGRLHRIAQALGVEVGYFFEGVGPDPDGLAPPGPAGAARRRRATLELARDFLRIRSRQGQEALCALARALASLPGPGQAPPPGGAGGG